MALTEQNMKAWTDRNDGSVECLNTDTDSGISGSTRYLNDRPDSSRDLRGSSQESLTSPCLSPAFMSPKKFTLELSTSPESPECEIDDVSSPYSNWPGKSNEECLQLRVEEHIEETTIHQYSDDISDGSESDESLPKETNKTVKTHKSQVVSEDELPSIVLPLSLPSMDLEMELPRRISFPEFGADLVEGTSADDLLESSDVILDHGDWEENWLFCKQKHKESPISFNIAERYSTAVEMLIPNPIDCILPIIGDQDIDELSDLSDQSLVSINSMEDDVPKYFQSGLYSTPKNIGEISNEEIIDEEDSQKNLEHTEHYTLLHPTKRKPLPEQTAQPSLVNKYHSCKKDTHRNAQNGVGYRPFKKPEKQSSRTVDISNLCAKTESTIPFPSSYSLCNVGLKHESNNLLFTSTMENQTVLEGKVLRLSCQISSRKPYDYRWYRNKDALQNDGRHIIRRQSNSLSLCVFDMSVTFTGEYTVVCYTEDDLIWTKCHVKIQENRKDMKSPKIIHGLVDTMVESGNDLTLACQVSGHPEPKVIFLRNGDEMNLPNFVIENDPYGTWILHIRNVGLLDEATITAVATNRKGQCRSSAVIQVCRPGEIQNVPTISAGTNNKILNNEERTFTAAEKSTPQKTHDKNSLPQAATPDANMELEETDRFFSGSSLFRPPVPGTIAEREHKKWLEAKPIINNPYSPEKLSRRLQTSPYRQMNYGGSPLSHAQTTLEEMTTSNWKPCPNLEKYSRDYLIGGSKISNDGHIMRHEKQKEQKYSEVVSAPPAKAVCDVSKSVAESLVPVKPFQPSNWKEELRNVRLDVSEKVGELQRKIDDIQKDWQLRIKQRSSRIKKQSRNYSRFNSGKDCTIYSSSEVLNLTDRDNLNQKLWKSTSVGDLTHATRNLNKRSDYKKEFAAKTRKEMATSTDALTDDTLSSIANSGPISTRSQSDQSCLEADAYQSDRSYDGDDVPQLPCVKDLASRFDSGPRKNSKKKQYSHREVLPRKDFVNPPTHHSRRAMHEVSTITYGQRRYSLPTHNRSSLALKTNHTNQYDELSSNSLYIQRKDLLKRASSNIENYTNQSQSCNVQSLDLYDFRRDSFTDLYRSNHSLKVLPRKANFEDINTLSRDYSSLPVNVNQKKDENVQNIRNDKSLSPPIKPPSPRPSNDRHVKDKEIQDTPVTKVGIRRTPRNMHQYLQQYSNIKSLEEKTTSTLPIYAVHYPRPLEQITEKSAEAEKSEELPVKNHLIDIDNTNSNIPFNNVDVQHKLKMKRFVKQRALFFEPSEEDITQTNGDMTSIELHHTINETTKELCSSGREGNRDDDSSELDKHKTCSVDEEVNTSPRREVDETHSITSDSSSHFNNDQEKEVEKNPQCENDELRISETSNNEKQNEERVEIISEQKEGIPFEDNTEININGFPRPITETNQALEDFLSIKLKTKFSNRRFGAPSNMEDSSHRVVVSRSTSYQGTEDLNSLT